MIVALGLPLNVAVIILGWILLMLLSVFIALGPTPPTMALTEFFQADTVARVHPLPVWWYLISSVCAYRCSCMQIMSILCSTADAVSSGSWPILFRVLTLNVAICIICLHFSSFCLSLSSVADFSNTEARAPTSAGRAPFFTRAKSDAVYVCGLSVGHSYLSMAVFILIYRSHSYRWAAVVLRSNWQSWTLSCRVHTSIMLLPMCTWKKKAKKKKKRGASFSFNFNLVKVQLTMNAQIYHNMNAQIIYHNMNAQIYHNIPPPRRFPIAWLLIFCWTGAMNVKLLILPNMRMETF